MVDSLTNQGKDINMKQVLAFVIISAFVLSLTPAFADQWVNGYTKRDGKYVQGHYRSDSDSSFDNNWSSSGNSNPYTGKKGYKKRSNW